MLDNRGVTWRRQQRGSDRGGRGRGRSTEASCSNASQGRRGGDQGRTRGAGSRGSFAEYAAERGRGGRGSDERGFGGGMR